MEFVLQLPWFYNIRFFATSAWASTLRNRWLLKLIILNYFITILFVHLLIIGAIRTMLIRLGFRYELELNAYFTDRMICRTCLLPASGRANHATVCEIGQVLGVERVYLVPLDYFLRRVDILEQLAHFQIHIAQISYVVLFPFTF